MKHRFWVGVYGDVEYGCMARQPAEEVVEEELEEKGGQRNGVNISRVGNIGRDSVNGLGTEGFLLLQYKHRV